MPEFVLEKTQRILNERGVALSRAKIVQFGIAYKADLDDWRESPAIEVFELLRNSGADVTVVDSWVPEFELHRESFTTVSDWEAATAACDLAIITTHHKNVDYQRVLEVAPVVFDTRNALKGLLHEKLIRL